MLYPHNPTVRNSIEAHIGRYFHAPVFDYYPRSFVLVSGGINSVALLANLLQYTQHEIHAHHVRIQTPANREKAQYDAMMNCMEYLRAHYREFSLTTSSYEMMVGGHEKLNVDANVAAFMGSRTHFSLGLKCDIFWMGHTRHLVYNYMDLGAIHSASHSFVRIKPVMIMPLISMNGVPVYSSIPPELAAVTFSCKNPRYNAAGAAAECGSCFVCQEMMSVRNYAMELQKNRLPVLPDIQFDTALSLEAANVKWPCFYPHRDMQGGILRCGVCPACQAMISLQQHKQGVVGHPNAVLGKSEVL